MQLLHYALVTILYQMFTLSALTVECRVPGLLSPPPGPLYPPPAQLITAHSTPGLGPTSADRFRFAKSCKIN